MRAHTPFLHLHTASCSAVSLHRAMGLVQRTYHASLTLTAAPTSYASWVSAHHAEAGCLFERTLGVASRNEREAMRQEADSWVAAFAKQQASRATAEKTSLRACSSALREAVDAASVLREASSRAFERRQRAVESADIARDTQNSHVVALGLHRYEIARACFVEARAEATGCTSARSALSRSVQWSLDLDCISEQGIRRKLQRLVKMPSCGTGRDCATSPTTAGGASVVVASGVTRDDLGESATEDPSNPLPGSKVSPGSQVEAGGFVRLSVLLDCPQLRRSADVIRVAHVRGLDAAQAVLALMSGCIALLYEYELGPEVGEGGYVTARPCSPSGRDIPAVDRLEDVVVVRHDLARPGPRCRRISNAEVVEVVRRRYQLQPCALQLFLRDGETVLLSITEGEAARDALHARLSAFLPRTGSADTDQSSRSLGSWPSMPFSSEKGELTDAWQRGATSNFEYLMQLNTLSGRCFDDLMQYPVLPWVLREHEKSGVNLRSATSFRDLRKPMGAQTDGRAAQFSRRYDDWQHSGEDTPPFHYGTHYSSAAAVSSFLIRLEPFSSLHCALQDGRIDLADRLFHSVNEEWKLASGEKGSDTGCVKELVPEMFYLWESMLNLNDLQLGRRQDGTQLDHVHLPRWARGSAWKFVRTLRQALESPHASKELPGWIDLIFGYQQQGEAAVAALNVFLPCTYMGAVDLASLDDAERKAIVSQIQLVGQTPEQLWRDRRHPARSSAAVFNTVPLVPLLVALAAAQKLLPAAESVAPFTPHTLVVSPGGERTTPLPAQAAVVPHTSLVMRWGFADGTVRFYRQRSFVGSAASSPSLVVGRLHGGEVIDSACVSNDGRWLATGGGSGSLVVWRLNHKSSPITVAMHGQLVGHVGPVRHLAFSIAHRLLASCSVDGVLLLWDLRKCLLVHALRVCEAPPLSLSYLVASSSMSAPSKAEGGVGRASFQPGEANVVDLAANEETGEVLVLSSRQLQLWSVNGSLLACSRGDFPPATALSWLQTPEWMVEHLAVAATGHEDGTLRFWTVREPLVGASLGTIPRALSRLPVRSSCLPAWELAELSPLRLERPTDKPDAITTISIGHGYDKLLWTASARGAVHAWRVAAPEALPDARDGEVKVVTTPTAARGKGVCADLDEAPTPTPSSPRMGGTLGTSMALAAGHGDPQSATPMDVS